MEKLYNNILLPQIKLALYKVTVWQHWRDLKQQITAICFRIVELSIIFCYRRKQEIILPFQFINSRHRYIYLKAYWLLGSLYLPAMQIKIAYIQAVKHYSYFEFI